MLFRVEGNRPHTTSLLLYKRTSCYLPREYFLCPPKPSSEINDAFQSLRTVLILFILTLKCQSRYGGSRRSFLTPGIWPTFISSRGAMPIFWLTRVSFLHYTYLHMYILSRYRRFYYFGCRHWGSRFNSLPKMGQDSWKPRKAIKNRLNAHPLRPFRRRSSFSARTYVTRNTTICYNAKWPPII